MFSYDEQIDRSDLLLRIKLLRDKVDAFESGTKYVQMKAEYEKAREADFRHIRRLERELAQSRKESIRIRELWYGTCEDVVTEKEREMEEKDREIKRLQKELADAKAKTEEERKKRREAEKECDRLKARLEEEEEKYHALDARLKKDYSNSSESSSMSPNHKKIPNSREKSGRKAGGQPGHIHHPRKKQAATEVIQIPAPAEYLDEGKYKPTGNIIRKQLIRMHVTTEVIEYTAEEYRNLKTGQRVHARFPEGLTDDVTYDASIKAMAYMINNSLYVSIDKTRTFLKDISHGHVDISNGFICKLAREFSEKTEDERNEIFLKMVASPVLHTDFTFGRRNGEQFAVIIAATEDGVLYQGREKKGNEGVKGSPLEHYDGTVVCDHESSLIKHGSRHQECLAHILRYAKGVEENEPQKTWASSLRKWVGNTIRYWNAVSRGESEYDEKVAGKYIDELRDILECAKKEYEEHPPSKYDKDGFNLYSRIAKDIESYVLFLRDPSVPPTNNLSERSARKVKRKSHQVMSFRSQEGVDHFCDGLTIMETAKAKQENVYDAVERRFRS